MGKTLKEIVSIFEWLRIVVTGGSFFSKAEKALSLSPGRDNLAD